MDAPQLAIAEKCLAGAEAGTMEFPEIVAALTAAGFDGYLVDYRRNVATYYSSGGQVGLDMEADGVAVAETFRPQALKAAIMEAQTKAPGYTYRGFCAKAKQAGCAGYLASLSGRRVLYFGRSGETHTELMPAPAGPAAARR